MELTPQNVESVFMSCLFEDGQNTDNAKIVKGVNMQVGFNPEKLFENGNNINLLLEQINPVFKQGMTFLNFCSLENGDIWTGEHRICDMLICLGIATGRVSFPFPDEMNNVLPGGVPYILIS